MSTKVIVTYPPNDIVNNIQNNKTDYANISFKKSNINDLCKQSSDCPDGLICAFNETNSYCARQIPVTTCVGQQLTNDINGNCGGSTTNNSGVNNW